MRTAPCRSSAAPSSALRPGILRDGEVADSAGAGRGAQGDLRRARVAQPRAARHRQPADRRAHARPAGCSTTRRRSPPPSSVEAPDHIPMPMDEAVLDWQSLGEVETAAGPRTRVVVVAVRRETVDRLVAARARGRPAGRGHRPVRVRDGPRAGRTAADGAVLYVSVAGLTNVAVANRAGCLFTRAAAGGLDAMVHTLADRRGLTVEHAQQWLQHVGLLADARRRRRGRRPRRRRPRGARGGRPRARRHGAQLAELLPHAGERRAGRARASSPAPPWRSPASSRPSPSS